VPTFSRVRQATLGLAPVPATVAERAAALQPAEQLVAERLLLLEPGVARFLLLEPVLALPDSAGVVGLRAERAPAAQIFSLGQEEFSPAVVRLAWRPADPAFCHSCPARTLLC